MAKVKLTKFRTSPSQYALVDTDATVGAQIGTNLLMPDGAVATTAKLAALFGAGTSATSIGTTDELEEGAWNLYFTKRRAQDAVGEILANSANVTLAYVGGASITADLTNLANSNTGTLQAITRDAKGRITGTRNATITGTADRVNVAHGDASDGLPTIDLAEVTQTTGGLLQLTEFDAWGRLSKQGAATTSNLAEGSNLYYTDARADARIAVQKGQPDGLASLDSDGKLDAGQLPALAITETFVVADEAAMLALIAEQGDVAVRTDLSESFILTADPASTLSNWQELLTPTGGVTSFNGRTGSVTPASGDYTFSQLGSRPTTLSGYGITDAATSAQGALADSAVQPSDLSAVATTGSYDDLTDKPTLGSAAAADVGDFDAAGSASAAQSAAEGYTDTQLADYTPTSGLGSAAFQPSTDFATAAQGDVADTAVQPSDLMPYAKTDDLSAVATSGAYADLSGLPSLGTAASHAEADFDPAGAADDAQNASEAYTDAAVAQPTPRAVVATAETFLTATGGETSAPLLIDGLTIEGSPTVTAIHQTDWQGRQLLFATARTNLITDSGMLVTTGTGAATSASFEGVVGTDKGVHLPGGVVGYNYFNMAKVEGVATFSTFVRMDDGGAPVVGTGSSLSYDFIVRVWGGSGSGIEPGSIAVTDLGGGLYRVSARSAAGASGTLTGIYKYAGNSARGVTVTGYQLEIDTSGVYIPTTDAARAVTDYTLFDADVSLGQVPADGAVLDWDGSGVPKYPASFAGPVRVGSYALATLPSAAAYAGYLITVSDATTGPALCVSNGTDWINVNTNAAVS